MRPVEIDGATHMFGAPKAWLAERHGECGMLPVRRDGDTYASAWRPSADDLAVLQAGGAIVLTVYGLQPPVALAVQLPSADATEWR